MGDIDSLLHNLIINKEQYCNWIRKVRHLYDQELSEEYIIHHMGSVNEKHIKFLLGILKNKQKVTEEIEKTKKEPRPEGQMLLLKKKCAEYCREELTDEDIYDIQKQTSRELLPHFQCIKTHMAVKQFFVYHEDDHVAVPIIRTSGLPSIDLEPLDSFDEKFFQ